MIQADEKTLESIVYMSQLKEFDNFMKLIDDSIEALHHANITAVGEFRAWNQGRLQELTNIKEQVRGAQGALTLLRGMTKRASYANPDI
jgi:small nuclear ribonucleoprotein (snRNP)-like protein